MSFQIRVAGAESSQTSGDLLPDFGPMLFPIELARQMYERV